MNVKIYRIMNKETKQFWNGKYWTNIGKTFSQIGHVKNSLNWLKLGYHKESAKVAVIVVAEEIGDWKEIDLINT